MIRFSFIKDGYSSNYYYKPLEQSLAIYRKENHLGFQLFNYLKKRGQLKYNEQVLANGIWEYKKSNTILK